MTQGKTKFSSLSPFSETRNNSIEQHEVTTKLQEIILKDKIQETNAKQRTDVNCSNSAAGQQSQSERNSSKCHQVLPKAHKPHERYFEGCLVLGRIACGYPLWPGMIRKPGSSNGCTKFLRGRIRFCVQFFEYPTTLRWLTPGMLRGFDAAKENRCRLRVATTPIVFLKFEKALRIAKAAASLSVKARLVKYALKENRKLKDSAMEAQEKRILKQRVENLELQVKLEKERVEKRNCQENLEKMRSEVLNLFGGARNELLVYNDVTEG